MRQPRSTGPRAATNRGGHLIEPVGPFSLQRAATFRFGPSEGDPPVWDGVLRLAFSLDDGNGYAGAAIRQPEPDGPISVDLQLQGTDDPQPALAQIRRILCLDQDGDAFGRVGERDPILGALQRDHHGQRPVLFPSPYEAVAWSVLSARWPLARGARVRNEVARDHGATFHLAGREVFAFPTPTRLASVPEEHPDLSPRKIDRLHGVALAAQQGQLDIARMTALGPEAAWIDLQRWNGIGPFYATLVVLRACGFTDAWLGPGQGRVDDAFSRFYGSADPDDVADGWRPFRTWAQVLVRIAARTDQPDPGTV